MKILKHLCFATCTVLFFLSLGVCLAVLIQHFVLRPVKKKPVPAPAAVAMSADEKSNAAITAISTAAQQLADLGYSNITVAVDGVVTARRAGEMRGCVPHIPGKAYTIPLPIQPDEQPPRAQPRKKEAIL